MYGVPYLDSATAMIPDTCGQAKETPVRASIESGPLIPEDNVSYSMGED
jgi:hypothetical protein